MTPTQAKWHIKTLGLTGVQFAELMGKSRSYVSDFNRDGVPRNIAIILELSQELLDKNVPQKRITEIITNHGKNLD